MLNIQECFLCRVNSEAKLFIALPGDLDKLSRIHQPFVVEYMKVCADIGN
jgi:hypothetical protein